MRLTRSIARSGTLQPPGRPMEVARVLPIPVNLCGADPLLSEPLHLNVGLVRVQQPRGPTPLRLSRTLVGVVRPVFGPGCAEFSHVLHKGSPRRTGNDSHVLPIQSPAALGSGRRSILRCTGGGVGLRHLRLHAQRRRGPLVTRPFRDCASTSSTTTSTHGRVAQRHRDSNPGAGHQQSVESPRSVVVKSKSRRSTAYLTMGDELQPQLPNGREVCSCPYVMRSHTTFRAAANAIQLVRNGVSNQISVPVFQPGRRQNRRQLPGLLPTHNLGCNSA